MNKFGQYVEMSFPVSDIDKKQAKNIIYFLKEVEKNIEALNDRLNIIYVPFSSHDSVSIESVWENRGALIRYKKGARDVFSDLAKNAAQASNLMSYFATDHHMSQLISSFVEAVGNIDDQMYNFEGLFDHMRSKNFKDGIINTIKDIKKQGAQVVKLIYDRILHHINTNILATNWQDYFTDDLKMKVDDQEPYIKRLYQEREKKINEILSRK